MHGGVNNKAMQHDMKLVWKEMGPRTPQSNAAILNCKESR